MPAASTRRSLVRSLARIATCGGLLGATAACGDAGASPAQPIAFPHRAHTENQIDCAFCHSYAEDHVVAGMPDTELCGTCHLAMVRDSAETQKLVRYVEAEERIPWVRLYQLPQYAYFPHKWHVRAGLRCEDCHGRIGDSVRATRHIELEMDWCVDCHERSQASTDCVTCHE